MELTLIIREANSALIVSSNAFALAMIHGVQGAEPVEVHNEHLEKLVWYVSEGSA